MLSSPILHGDPALRSGSTWAALAPALCAVHCLAAPLITAVAPALVDAPALEWALFVLSVATVGMVLPAGARLHAQRRYLALAIGALAVWALALAGSLTSVPAESVITAASLTTAGALLANLRRLRRDRGPTAAGCAMRMIGCVERRR